MTLLAPTSLLVFMIRGSSPLILQDRPVIGFESTFRFLGRNWLENFQTHRVLQLPIIPGSHNSGSYKRAASRKSTDGLVFIWARQQLLSIADQLNLGVRALDFRLHAFDDLETVKLSHSIDLDYDLAEALREVKLFLEENKTEFVILLVRIDWHHRFHNQEQERIDAKRALISKIFIDSQLEFFQETPDHPLSQVVVSELAGKVIMVSHTEGLDRVFPQNNDADPHPQFIDFARYKVKDIWRRKRLVSAKRDLDQYMAQQPVAEDGDSKGSLRGVAIDMTTLIHPAVVSPRLNKWFLKKLQQREAMEHLPIGVLLLDFICPKIMQRILLAIFRHHYENQLRDQSASSVSV